MDLVKKSTKPASLVHIFINQMVSWYVSQSVIRSVNLSVSPLVNWSVVRLHTSLPADGSFIHQSVCLR